MSQYLIINVNNINRDNLEKNVAGFKMGLRKIEEDIKKQGLLKKRGSELAIAELEQLIKDVKALHRRLEDLEKKYGDELKKNPKAAQELMELRAELGLPTYIGLNEVQQKKGLLSKLFGKVGFHEYLALQLLEIAKNRQEVTGGLISVAELLIRINKKVKGVIYTIDDVFTALKILERNKLIYKVRELESGFKVVEVVPLNLTNAHEEVLRLAHRFNGELSYETIMKHLNWNLAKTEAVIKELEEKQLVYTKVTAEGPRIYFPSI